MLPSQWPLAAVVVLFGALLGSSPFVAGFYEPGKWVPIGLGLLTLATAGAIAKPPRLSVPAIGALGALMGIAVWALLSSAWAPSIEQATVEGNRNFVLAAILATAVVLVRTDAMARWLVGGLVGGIAAVALYVIVNMIGGHPGSLFLGGRLDQPLGYINAEGTVFLMGFWLCFSLVERRSPRLAGLGAGGATLMACMGLLSESRGAALAMAASLVVVVALVPGDPIRRLLGLLTCAAGLAGAAGPLLDVYHAATEGRLDAGVAQRAGVAACIATVLAGLVWGAGVAVQKRLIRERPALGAPLRRAARSALAAGLVVVLAIGVVSAGHIERTVSSQWTAFVHLSEPTGSAAAASVENRLVSGSGNRYDYWRIAWDAFRDRPFGGVGAGNYDRPYFEARRTTEDVRQPHSLEMQALSELGIVGGLLVAAFIVALGFGAWRMRGAAAASSLTQGLMIAGVGSVTAWLVHTSVDWVHLMPGVTGVALAMGAVVLRERGPVPMPVPARAPVPSRRWALRSPVLAAAGLAGLALVIAAASLSRQGLADFFRHRASDALAQRPLEAIREANRSLRLDAENPRTYYVKAAALARFNQGDAARAVLQQALAKEPDDFVTWTLLGDLAVRQGNLAEAKRNYQRAAALNPRDAGIRALAQDPRQALPGATP